MNVSSKIVNNSAKLTLRHFSKYGRYENTSKQLRQRFLEFFINENNHNFVRSSPVVPLCDPSLAFVNAGMNQFKGILLGIQKPQHLRVANSQKCIRIGGKHNDLNVIGCDGYHHTFFEMLGNWSFGDYFKKEACELAWKLLTDVYKINQETLYVTYFAGDKALKLEPDLECKDIWESIGVTKDRILPFGIKDNFWEMGTTGPCGPCTEIHVDRRGTTNRAQFVNKGLPDLLELWNIVFIQFFRDADGNINSLSQQHVDTGLGLERLCALLQGKISNYDTDLFYPMFEAVHKISRSIPEYGGKFGEADWNQLDTNYRILADHVRMITVCLADGVIPEENQKLRRIMRRVFSISESCFKIEKGLLKELTNYVVDKLGSVYPEMEKNIEIIHQIIDHEEKVYREIRTKSAAEWNNIIKLEPRLSALDIIEMPGLVAAYKELKSLENKILSPQMSFKLFDTYGLDQDSILKLSEKLNIKFNPQDLQDELQKAKIRSRSISYSNDKSILDALEKAGIQTTDDSYKYNYGKDRNNYIFKPLEVKLLKVIQNSSICDTIIPNVECSLILDKSNFYTESGGQSSDKGFIKINNSHFDIYNVEKKKGYVFHTGYLKSNDAVQINSKGIINVHSEERLRNMQNHTAVHLLNSTLKYIKGATSQKSSKVIPNYLNLDICIFGPKLTMEEIELIETRVNDVIKSKVDVKITEVDSQEFLSLNNVITIPGEVYPDSGIRLVEVATKDGFLSREPCCGTHVVNTGDIEDFVIINIQSLSRSTTSIIAVTGNRACEARKNGIAALENIISLQRSLNDNIDRPELLDSAISTLMQSLKYNVEDSNALPIIIKHRCQEELNKISKQMRDTSKRNIKKFIEEEMDYVLQTKRCRTENNQEYIVHYLRCSTMLDTVPLQKATKMCPNIPILVISYSDSTVKARCCVPEHIRNKHFNAEKWLSFTVSSIFKCDVSAPKGQDPSLVCNMKSKRIKIKDWDSLLNQSLVAAKEYVEKHL